MRLMLGTENAPTLLVSVNNGYNPDNFDFYVINGNWDGHFTNGHITVLGPPSGDYSSLEKLAILCDNQDRLRGEYNDVFNNFDNVEYVAPKFNQTVVFEDDDIPF